MTFGTKKRSLWRRGISVLRLLALMGFAPALHAEGLDELYEKPSSEKSWGEIAAELVGYDGFTKSYALVVGISDFTGGYRGLPTEEDPIRIRDFLINEAGFDYVHVLTEEQVTYPRLRQLMVNVFPRLVDGDDRFFFYWCGHGTQQPNRHGGQVGYLPLASSERDDFASMVSMEDVRRWDNLIDGRHVLFFLDACLSGLAGTASKAETQQIEFNDLVKPAHHLITAGTKEEETIAGDRWGGSVFTHAFLRAVRVAADTDSLDFPKDGVVSLFELIKHVRDYVPREARSAGWNKAITPQLRDLGGSDGEFFFVTSEERLAELERRGETPSGELRGGQAVSKGDETPALSPSRIRQVQEMLTELGFQPGEPDGVFGARTRAAIIAFQRSIGEAATGELSEAEELQLALAYADRQASEPAAASDEPASPFRDCPDCPEMLVIPAGSFTMGSPASEEGREDDEGPQREVLISSYALGRYEVTRRQFARFVSETGHETGRCAYWDVEAGEAKWGDDRNWRSPGFEQTDDHPVTCVSWEDAQAYVAWLSKTTGERYRLPSEAEWEYAARAGTTTRYFWGDESDSACSFANGHDVTGKRENKFAWTSFSCDDDHAQTAPVGQFDPNSFGVYDMTGNVWEWVEDKYHENYEGAPTEGSAWVVGNNSARVLRGGSWFYIPRYLRSANRIRYEPYDRNSYIGFRVARTLTP